MIRLNKYLAQCEVASRRKCDILIQDGWVKINGKKVLEPFFQVDENRDIVTFKSKIVKPRQKKIYILLNKPEGYVTTVSDEKGRKTVLDLVPRGQRIYPVGRLDLNTSGALLLTNDGDLAYKVTHPKSEVDKTYHIHLDRSLKREHLLKLRKGVLLDGRPTSSAVVNIISNDSTWLEMVIHEGRNRQVRRMVEVLDYKVSKLVRIKFANLEIIGLKPGQWRYLGARELNVLKKMIQNVPLKSGNGNK